MSEPMPVDQLEETEQETQDDAIIGKALAWSFIGFSVVAVSVAAVCLILLREPDVEVEEALEIELPRTRELPSVEVPRLPFTDITVSAGLQYQHRNGATGEKLMPETLAGGCAFFDFDSDGDQDILLLSGTAWPWTGEESPESDDQTGSEAQTPGLFENDGNGRFTDRTAGSGLDVPMYGMGIACGDYDNDGLVDVYLTCVGGNRLFHNDGDGKFREVTDETGTGGGAAMWSTSCGWLDYDLDGDLDLFVCNYVEWTRELDLSQEFTLDGSRRAYGRPQEFTGTYPTLYRNEGRGHFTDVSAEAGIQITNPSTEQPLAKSLGLCFSDANNDGRLDIFVANDTVQNLLLLNQPDGTFQEAGAMSGIAFDIQGNARGAMGMDAGWIRNAESLAIAIGNFSNEMTALYVTQGPPEYGPQFNDEAVSNGIGPVTRVELTFGLFFFDCDLDGRLDLFAANGHLEEEIHTVQPSQHYEQPPQLLWNCGPEYENEFMVADQSVCGPDFTRRMVGRGAARADIDGDGDLDILIATSNGSPRLLRNDQNLGHHWLRIRLEGTTSARDAIGARVTLTLPDGSLQKQVVMPTCSYLSQSERTLTFGLGPQSQIESLEVAWPDGTTQTHKDIAVDQVLSLRQDGTGRESGQ